MTHSTYSWCKRPKRKLGQGNGCYTAYSNRVASDLAGQNAATPFGWLRFELDQRDSNRAGVNGVPVARQSREAARPQAGNPVGRTTSSRTLYRSRRRFLFQSKRHLSLTPSLLLSKSKPHGRFMPRRQLRHSAVLGFDFVIRRRHARKAYTGTGIPEWGCLFLVLCRKLRKVTKHQRREPVLISTPAFLQWQWIPRHLLH